MLGQFIYDMRRRNGIFDPTKVFIFDEADIFIPRQSATAIDEE